MAYNSYSYSSITERMEEEDGHLGEVWHVLDKERNGRVPLHILRDRLLYTTLGDTLPPEAITVFLKNADENHDGYIDKNEFLAHVKNTPGLPRIRSIVRDAGLLVVPRSGRITEVRTYLQEFTCWPPVIFIPIITVLEISTFIYYAVEMHLPVTASSPTPIHSTLIYNPARRYEAWRYITYMLIHAGWLHLVGNLVIQLVLGSVLEMVHKWWRVMIVYIIGVFGGALATSVTTPNAYLAGASGGVYSIVYAYLGNLILNWSEMEFPIIQSVVIFCMAAFDVGYAIYDTYLAATPSNVGHMAHLGGAIAGILVGVNILRNLKLRRWEKYLWWIAFVLLLVLFSAAIIVNIVSPAGFYPEADYSSIT